MQEKAGGRAPVPGLNSPRGWTTSAGEGTLAVLCRGLTAQTYKSSGQLVGGAAVWRGTA